MLHTSSTPNSVIATIVASPFFFFEKTYINCVPPFGSTIKVGIEVALWHQNQPNIKTCKVCKERFLGDEDQLFSTCFVLTFVEP